MPTTPTNSVYTVLPIHKMKFRRLDGCCTSPAFYWVQSTVRGAVEFYGHQTHIRACAWIIPIEYVTTIRSDPSRPADDDLTMNILYAIDALARRACTRCSRLVNKKVRTYTTVNGYARAHTLRR